MMNSSRNQNMDSWKFGNRYDALQSMDTHENMKGALQKKSVVKLVVPMKTYKEELQDKYWDDKRCHECSLQQDRVRHQSSKDTHVQIA